MSVVKQIEACWYGNNRLLWLLLLPFSLLYWLVISLRKLAYAMGIKPQCRVKAPVIIVGNITVGGTGKTPFTLWLCRYLQQLGMKPGIISRGYGADVPQPLLVQPHHLATEVGDEPLLLARRSLCPVVVCRNRVAAANYLLQHTDCDIIISDDGLQHYRLQRDLEIVLIDGTRQLGNGCLLPAGPLRERASRLKQVDIVVANTTAYPAADGVMTLNASQAISLIDDQQTLAPGSEVTLVAAIGNPERFRTTAQQAGFQIKESHFFTDHHPFKADELVALAPPLLMTEKDAVKCRTFARSDWFSLAVEAELSGNIQQLLTEKLTIIRRRYYGA